MNRLQMHRARVWRSFAAAAMLLGFSSATIAQTPVAEPRPTITISGAVRDSAGNPVVDASVFLTERATATSVETKTKSDGTFSFLALRPGTYTVRAEKAGLRTPVSASLLLSPEEKKQLDLVLEPSQASQSPSAGAKKYGSSAAMEFDDKPSFTVAGVTDWTNVGGHGSDTKLRTSESLAKETATLKSAEPGETAAATSEVARVSDSHRLAGDRAEHSGDPLAAVREYEQAVRVNPAEQNYFAWGTELLLHRAIKPAAEVFTKGSVVHPKSARMLAGLGAALYASGSYADAARRVCEASDLQPADPTPYLFLGKMEKAAPDPLPCVEQKLARFTHDQPANALANYYYAVALWKQSRGAGEGPENSPAVQHAEALLQMAVTADPKLDAAYVQLGILYDAQGNPTQAIGAYKKAVEANPQSGEAHYRLALAYKRTGEDEKSEKELQLYKQADKSETAAIEQQRREIRQFLIILRDQPSTPPGEQK
jgi:tetratricopeptide (TPR) repeat protein